MRAAWTLFSIVSVVLYAITDDYIFTAAILAGILFSYLEAILEALREKFK